MTADPLELAGRVAHTARYAPRFGDHGTPHGLEALAREALTIDDPDVHAAAWAILNLYGIATPDAETPSGEGG